MFAMWILSLWLLFLPPSTVWFESSTTFASFTKKLYNSVLSPVLLETTLHAALINQFNNRTLISENIKDLQHCSFKKNSTAIEIQSRPAASVNA